MGHCHIYCRVSSTGQEDNYSLDTQEAACRVWAAERGLVVASVVHEVWSGADRHRPQLDALLARLLPGDVMLSYDLDRLSRGGQVDTAVIIDRIESAGASVAFVTFDFEQSETGTLIRSVRAFAAALEREKIGERTQRGRRARVDSGKPLPSGKPPYGYQWADEAKSRLVLDAQTAPVVRLIYDLALTGTSLRGIIAALAERGIPSPTGKPRWAVPTVRELLRRPVYTGTSVAYRERFERKPRGGYTRREASAEEQIVLPNIAPAIVSADEFAAVQARLAYNKAHATRNNRRPEATLLRAGFIRCGHCGHAMHADWNINHGALYRCFRGNRERDACSFPSILAKFVDPQVWQRVADVLRDPAIIAREVERRRDDGSLVRERDALSRRIEAFADKQARMARRVAEIDDDEVAAPLIVHLKSLAGEKIEAQRERDALEQRIADRADEDARVRSLAEWCQRVGTNLDLMSYDQKRLALEAFDVKVRVWRPGEPERPRWEVTMRPAAIATENAVLSRSTHLVSPTGSARAS